MKIEKNPKEESNNMAFIKLYSDNNQKEKAAAIIKKLEVAVPESEWAQVGLFKYYLDKNEAPKAIKAMNLVLASAQIDANIKHRVLNEFMGFVAKNPQYSPDLEQAIVALDKDLDAKLSKEIGTFYAIRKQWDKSIPYYEMVLKKGSGEDVETNLLLLQAYAETKQFEIVA